MALGPHGSSADTSIDIGGPCEVEDFGLQVPALQRASLHVTALLVM